MRGFNTFVAILVAVFAMMTYSVIAQAQESSKDSSVSEATIEIAMCVDREQAQEAENQTVLIFQYISEYKACQRTKGAFWKDCQCVFSEEECTMDLEKASENFYPRGVPIPKVYGHVDCKLGYLTFQLDEMNKLFEVLFRPLPPIKTTPKAPSTKPKIPSKTPKVPSRQSL